MTSFSDFQVKQGVILQRATPSLAVLGLCAGIGGALGEGFRFVGTYGLAQVLASLSQITGSLLIWIGLTSVAIAAFALQGKWSQGAVVGLATIAATIGLPLATTSLLGLGDLSPSLVQSPATDPTHSIGLTLITLGDSVHLMVSVFLLVVFAVTLSRLARVPGWLALRSPYRTEVLALVVAFTVLAVTLGSPTRTLEPFGDWWSWYLLLQWLIPCSLALTLFTRFSGPSTVWTAFTALTLFSVWPWALSMALTLNNNALTSGYDAWSDSIQVAATGWLVLPLLALAIVCVLWYASPRQAGPPDSDVDVGAPLEPWAGAAFIFAFLPLLSIPAIFLGHTAYERINAQAPRIRGRLFCASAITLGILNITALGLFLGGALTALFNALVRG